MNEDEPTKAEVAPHQDEQSALRSGAIHEAGHVVAALSNGVYVRSVFIKASPYLDGWDVEGAATPNCQSFEMRSRVQCLLGGCVAEFIAGIWDPNGFGGTFDFMDAETVCDDADLLKQMQSETVARLRFHWSAVASLAAALIINRRLGAKSLRAVAFAAAPELERDFRTLYPVTTSVRRATISLLRGLDDDQRDEFLAEEWDKQAARIRAINPVASRRGGEVCTGSVRIRTAGPSSS